MTSLVQQPDRAREAVANATAATHTPSAPGSAEKVIYRTNARKRARLGWLQDVSPCGRMLKIRKVFRHHWINVEEVEAIYKGGLCLRPVIESPKKIHAESPKAKTNGTPGFQF